MRNPRLGMVAKLELVNSDLANPGSFDPSAKGRPLYQADHSDCGIVAWPSHSILDGLPENHPENILQGANLCAPGRSPAKKIL